MLWSLEKILSDCLIVFLKAYRLLLAPIFLSLGTSCRFTPTCSHYAEQAVQKHGLGRGLGLALWRLGRCQPFCRGGWDPVPHEKI